MAVTYTRKVASAVAAGDKISAMTVQRSGGRVYNYSKDATTNVVTDDRPTVVSVTQIKAPGETNDRNPDGNASGPLYVALTYADATNSSASPQSLVLAVDDNVIVSSGTF